MFFRSSTLYGVHRREKLFVTNFLRRNREKFALQFFVLMDRIPLEVSQPQKDFVFAHFQSNFKTIDANDGDMKALGNATETRHLQVFPLLHIS